MSLSGGSRRYGNLSGSNNGNFNSISTNSILQQNTNADIVVTLSNSMGFDVVAGPLKVGSTSSKLTTLSNSLVNTNQTLNWPNVNGGSDNIVSLGSVDALQNKTLTNCTINSSSNTNAATHLMSATTSVNTSSATAPSAGQSLVALSSSTASWQNKSYGLAYNTSSFNFSPASSATWYANNQTGLQGVLTANGLGNNFALSGNTYGLIYSGNTATFKVSCFGSATSLTTQNVFYIAICKNITVQNNYVLIGNAPTSNNVPFYVADYVSLSNNDVIYFALQAPFTSGSNKMALNNVYLEVQQIN